MLGRGHQVRALARGPYLDDARERADVEVVRGDLADAGALARLCDGAQVLVHAAGVVKARTGDEFFAVNAAGAAAAAKAVGEGRMVLVSSLSAREPQLSAYAASKRAGETAAARVLAERLSILRPPAIYGPGDRATLPLFRLARLSPALPTPDMPRARVALAYVKDVADAVCGLVASAGRPGPYDCGGDRPEGYSWREIMTALAHAAGREPILVPIPPWTLLPVGALSEGLGRLGGRAVMFSRGKAREVLHQNWAIDPQDEPPGDRARATPLETGFRLTADWYLEHGWVR